MDSTKLFRVLVIGGAMLGLGCEDPPVVPEEDAGGAIARDAGPSVVGDAAPPPEDASVADLDAGSVILPQPEVDAGGAELEECGLCPNELCCESHEDGTSTTRPGMMCCWGTSC